jgi:hypothetical protein
MPAMHTALNTNIEHGYNRPGKEHNSPSLQADRDHGILKRVCRDYAIRTLSFPENQDAFEKHDFAAIEALRGSLPASRSRVY